MSKLIDLSGKRFGRLVVISHIAKTSKWLCKCECGNEASVKSWRLRHGVTKSCGCIIKEFASTLSRSHMQSKSRIYNTWSNMKARCNNPKLKYYENYGGRGIIVFEEWQNSFEMFFKWAMANGYSDSLTIDRIDNNGNYCPENCHWIPKNDQANNRRTNRIITYKGVSKTVAEWSKSTGLSQGLIIGRLNRGWIPEKIFFQSIRKHKKYKSRKKPDPCDACGVHSEVGCMGCLEKLR
jgi:hypothetical protein